MKFPIMLRSTHEVELKTAIDGLKGKSRLIDSLNITLNNKSHEINCLKHEIKDLELEIKERDSFRDKLLIELEQKDKKLKKLEEYIEKLEHVSKKKDTQNCKLNTKLIDTETKCKDLDQANRKLIDLYNDANRKNWCNNESARQLKKLSQEILESDKINKTNLATYIYNISQYMGGGIPAEIKVLEDIDK